MQTKHRPAHQRNGSIVALALLVASSLIGCSPTSAPLPDATTRVATNTPASDLGASPTPSASPIPSPEPTATPLPPARPITYTVQAGDTLYGIALEHDTTVDALKSANGLHSDTIFPGDVLTIPMTGTLTAEPLSPTAADATIPVTPSASTALWLPSPLGGDLQKAYPLTVETERFTLHYQPNSPAARDRELVVKMIETALEHVEKVLQVKLDGRLDVYAAGSLFAPPDMALRGRSFSAQRRFFFLYDDSGTPADRLYILTHELTHPTTWNTLGQPASVMLHEGVAVYTGMELIKNEGYLSLATFCAAYHQIGQIPDLTAAPSFQGHIRNLDTYYAAGCFVQYLIEKYGAASFGKVYDSGDFVAAYGKSLSQLQAEWLASLDAAHIALPFDPRALADNVTKVADDYDRLFANFTGTAVQLSAYRELDRARTALLQGRLADVVTHLSAFDALLAQ